MVIDFLKFRNFKMCGRHLLLQPHLDDIAFSIGHVLSEKIIPREEAIAYTIFGKETFNIRNYANCEKTLKLLEKEEEQWFSFSKIRYDRFCLEEAGYRGISNVRTLFQPKAANVFSETAQIPPIENGEDVNNLVKELVRGGYRYIWVPAGVGGHCDHLAVRQSVLNHMPSCPETQIIFFYEELPYSHYSAPIKWEEVFISGFKFAGRVVYQPEQVKSEQKASNLEIFYSQINESQAKVLSAQAESFSIWIRNENFEEIKLKIT
ncbi:MAG: hypothetical protein FWC09_01290 [Lachnospiraceae bacterium]|nr:hypothetical protein [Lachnospiraceae bacterium]